MWHRRANSSVIERWSDEIDADRVGTTRVVRLEVLYSARSAADYAELAQELDGLVQVPCGEDALDRAEEVQAMLARHRALHHRSVRIPDLVIAAAAELAGATMWHYDEDYDRIADMTGQPSEWIVPRGSIN